MSPLSRHTKGGLSHARDDRVAVVCRYKILHLARLRSAEMAAADKVRRQIVLGRRRAGHAVGVAIDAVDFGCHCVGFEAHTQSGGCVRSSGVKKGL
jgi:hypothetical protein